MKIIFGHIPYAPVLDIVIMPNVSGGISLEVAMDNFIKVVINTDLIFCTINPLLINYLEDDIAKEHVYYLSKDDQIKFGDDQVLCKKLKFMGPGEALADSEHVL